MEPSAKKPRLGASNHVDDDDDELNYEPEEISQRRDPGYQLQQERGYAADRLKSTLEHIFLKYGRDFTGVGDEIDLRTGEIVVNNGHLRNMRTEKDAGDKVDEYEDEDEGILLSEMYGSDDDEDDDEQSDEDAEEDLILHGKGMNATAQPAPEERPSRKPTIASRNAPVPTPIRLATHNRLANLSHSRYTPQKPSPLSAGAWEIDENFVDPAWRAPPLVRSSLPPMRTPARDENLYQLPAVKGTDSLWASDSSNMEWPSGGYIPKARGPVASSSPTRRFMPTQPEVDEEDEILMGGPDKPTAKRAGSMKNSVPEVSPLPQEKTGPKKQPTKAKGPGKGKKPTLAKPPRTPESSKSEPDVRPRRTFVVAIPFRTPPPPESLTVVDDTLPRSDRTRADSATPTPKEATQETPVQASEVEAEPIIQDSEQLSAPLASPRLPTPPASSVVLASAAENDPESTEHKDQPPPPVEKFSRNEIDPSYEFSDEDDLPARKPLEVALLVPEQAPPVAAEAEVPQAAKPVAKRKPGRPKGWKKQKSKPEDVLPSIVEAILPGSPPRPPVEEQPLLPVEVIIRDSEEEPSSAEVEESPELTGLPDDQELPDVEDFSAAQEQPDAEEAHEYQELPDAEEATEVQETADQELIDLLGDISPKDLPMIDPPETETEDEDAAPEETQQEPSPAIAPNKRLRNLALKATAEANIPSPIRSDDSLTLALDSIIASQGLFDDSDRNPESSPAKPDESPTRRVASLRSSTRKRRRSVHFLEEELLDNPHKTKIISTPPLRKGLSQPGEAIASIAQETTPPPQDTIPEPTPTAPDPDVIDLTSIPDEAPPSPAGGMFAARKARRRKGASLSSSPAPSSLPGVKKPAKRGPAIRRLAKEPKEKRRSLLSIALVDSDDEDPLNAMSLLPTWTTGVAWSPYGASSTPLETPKHNGSESTTRKRIAREGFGGLSTPTKRTGFMAAGSPSGSVIFTPGGHARRCGVDDFWCGRDFCFTCLEG